MGLVRFSLILLIFFDSTLVVVGQQQQQQPPPRGGERVGAPPPQQQQQPPPRLPAKFFVWEKFFWANLHRVKCDFGGTYIGYFTIFETPPSRRPGYPPPLGFPTVPKQEGQGQQQQPLTSHSQGSTLQCLLESLVKEKKGDAHKLSAECRHEILRSAVLAALLRALSTQCD